MSMRGDMTKAIRKAVKHGWTATQSKRNGHILLIWKNGERVTASLSPSCGRAVKNFIADLKRVEKNSVDKIKS